MVTGSRPTSVIVDGSLSEGVDMIMIVTRGQGGLEHLWIGSVAERVVQHTELPVFLLPGHDGSTPQPQPVTLVGEASVVTSDSGKFRGRGR